MEYRINSKGQSFIVFKPLNGINLLFNLPREREGERENTKKKTVTHNLHRHLSYSFSKEMADLSNKIEDLKLEGEAVKVAPANAAENATQNVTPWDVEGAVVDGVQQAIDYNKLIDQFGTRPIDDALLERFEKLTGRKPHIFLRRGTFFSHR